MEKYQTKMQCQLRLLNKIMKNPDTYKTRTDFSTWKRENLEKLAAELTNEVIRLTKLNEQRTKNKTKLNIKVPSNPEDDGC